MKEQHMFEDVLVVFCYARAGLGHFRVLDALAQGVPTGVDQVVLSTADTKIEWIHRVMSVNLTARRVMELVQRGRPEDIFTRGYRASLRRSNGALRERLLQVVSERIKRPKRVLVVATHFGLAHQIASIKGRLAQESGIAWQLAVIVTDDSPQHIWFVPGVDIAFVPSEMTKRELATYGRKEGLGKVKFAVAAYPISPEMTQSLTSREWQRRIEQVEPDSEARIEMVLPISGAAVGMQYYQGLIKSLGGGRSWRYWVVVREMPATQSFIRWVKRRKEVRLAASKDDREVVSLYQSVYLTQPMAFEVTKPSEQAFKALYETNTAGGSILLLTQPVGRQEWDNLKFLRRHCLIPGLSEQAELQRMCREGVKLNSEWRERIRRWRGIRLPERAEEAARFIEWGLASGLFKAMVKGGRARTKMRGHDHELTDQGVARVWEQLGKLL